MFHRTIDTAASNKAVSLAQLVAAFSYALDITEGQPAGHGVRACWIGLNIGQAIGLGEAEIDDVTHGDRPAHIAAGWKKGEKLGAAGRGQHRQRFVFNANGAGLAVDPR